MGQTWDGGDVAFRKETWEKVLRVLKPGAFLMAFGGSRTYHRLTVAIEDAGFEIKDGLVWVHSTGMPKSLDISKKADQKAGKLKDRKVVGKYQPPGMGKPWNLKRAKNERSVGVFASSRNNLDVTEPVTEMARDWNGYGSNLKPSIEPIVLAMKPLEGGYLENAEKWGVSGLNIGGSRIDSNGKKIEINTFDDGAKMWGGGKGHPYTSRFQEGRWPSNFLLDCSCPDGDHNPGCPVAILERQHPGASEFYYCSKPSTLEKTAGLDSGDCPHPTTKPISLLKWLWKLLIPPVRASGPRKALVCFSGGGSEMCGAMLAGWESVTGVEISKEYVNLAKKRLKWWQSKAEKTGFSDVDTILKASDRDSVKHEPLGTLFD